MAWSWELVSYYGGPFIWRCLLVVRSFPLSLNRNYSQVGVNNYVCSLIPAVPLPLKEKKSLSRVRQCSNLPKEHFLPSTVSIRRRRKSKWRASWVLTRSFYIFYKSRDWIGAHAKHSSTSPSFHFDCLFFACFVLIFPIEAPLFDYRGGRVLSRTFSSSTSSPVEI